VADDRVAAAAAELYGADPEAFTERRKALAAAARDAGQRDAATAIAALRKPTRAAWVVNRLARADPDAPARMAALAAELRAAERAKDGPRLRELSAARGALLDALTAQALAAAGGPDPPSSLRAEVTATLTAALADPETAAAFAAGTLTKAAQWSGFGYADLGPADDSSPDGTRSPAASGPAPTNSAPVDIATRRSRRARTAANSGSAAGGTPLAEPDHRSPPSHPIAAPRPTRAPSRTDRTKHDRADANPAVAAAAQRAAREQQRLAQEAAERAARAREKYEDAERTVAHASTAAAEADALEDRLEAEVRDLEERLTKARDDLADARRRARHAEAAERRARQALDRLPRP
jgi:hypothetical protein